MNDIHEWSNATFGDKHRNPAIVHHLKKEVDELIESLIKTQALGADPSVGAGEFGRQLHHTDNEYADCFMLILDSARKFGLSAASLISITEQKLAINKARTWGTPDENGVVEHVKG